MAVIRKQGIDCMLDQLKAGIKAGKPTAIFDPAQAMVLLENCDRLAALRECDGFSNLVAWTNNTLDNPDFTLEPKSVEVLKLLLELVFNEDWTPTLVEDRTEHPKCHLYLVKPEEAP